jgi:hypothetical protein
MSTKYHLRERLFLNLNLEMRAYAIAIVEDTSEIAMENVNDWKYPIIELRFADCIDEISFSFDLSSTENRENSLHKIREIARIVNTFREAIEIEAAAIKERQLCMPLKASAATVH